VWDSANTVWQVDLLSVSLVPHEIHYITERIATEVELDDCTQNRWWCTVQVRTNLKTLPALTMLRRLTLTTDKTQMSTTLIALTIPMEAGTSCKRHPRCKPYIRFAASVVRAVSVEAFQL
jgi:hypothetical protein